MIPQKRLRLIALVLIGLVVVLIGILIFISAKHSQEAKLNIYVLPEDSTIKLDDQVIKKKSIYVKPGEHTISASKNGFKTDVRMVSLIKQESLDLYLLPSPESQEAQDWLAQNPDLQRLREEYAAHNATSIQQELQKQYPILDSLPLITRYYRIDYGVSKKYPNDPSKVALYITAVKANRNMALQWIKFKGFNPNDYEIIYRNP
jgi:hypothetical protein